MPDIKYSMWKRYRKLPIIVEAREVKELEYISTLEGIMRAKPGDYVVRGLVGEIYPVNRAVFAGTYEPVEENMQDELMADSEQ